MSGKSPICALRNDRSGGAALEFALVAPAFLALVFGLFQLGWAMHCGSSVRYAVEQAARSVMMDPDMTAAEVQDQVEATLEQVADPTNLSVDLTYDTSRPGVRLATVSAIYHHHIAVPFVPAYTLVYRPTATAPA